MNILIQFRIFFKRFFICRWNIEFYNMILQLFNRRKKIVLGFFNLSPRFLSTIWKVIYLRNVRISRAKQLWKYWPVIKVSHMVYWITSTINQRTVFSWTLNFISDVSHVTTMFAWRQNDKHCQNAQGLRAGFAVRSTRRPTLLLLITAWAIVH